MSAVDTITDVLIVDHGPVDNAAYILVVDTTLAGHVTVSTGAHTTRYEMNKDIPFEVWGSGTQALWRLLSAIAYSRHEVSLYEVASRLDRRNSAAVAGAMAALFGVPR